MPYSKKIGLELEYSDISTKKAVEIVYKYFNLDISKWDDSRSVLDKISLDYSSWNAVSDLTIKNSDSSKMLSTYFEDGKLKRANPENLEERKKWKGIEVISPPTNSYQQLFSDIESLSSLLVSNGAKISRYLDNALHIHIDASDLNLDQIKKVIERSYKIQGSLKKFYTYNGIPVPEYTDQDIELFKTAETIEDLYRMYFWSDSRLSTTTNNAMVRRVINVGPWLYRNQENKTVEFRCFSNSYNIEYIKEAVFLSLDIFDYLLSGDLNFDIDQRTAYVESLHK